MTINIEIAAEVGLQQNADREITLFADVGATHHARGSADAALVAKAGAAGTGADRAFLHIESGVGCRLSDMLGPHMAAHDVAQRAVVGLHNAQVDGLKRAAVQVMTVIIQKPLHDRADRQGRGQRDTRLQLAQLFYLQRTRRLCMAVTRADAGGRPLIIEQISLMRLDKSDARSDIVAFNQGASARTVTPGTSVILLRGPVSSRPGTSIQSRMRLHSFMTNSSIIA